MVEKVIVKSASSDLDGAQFENAATEATLKRLVELMEKQKPGSGSSVNNTAQQAKDQGIQPKITKEANNAFEAVGGAAKKAAAGIGGMAVDATKFLASGAFALLGSGLLFLKDTIGESMNTLRDTAKSGGSFNGSLLELNRSAAASGMNLKDFSGFIQANKATMATFGGTVTEGAKRMGMMANELRRGDVGQQLQALGVSTEDINNGMAQYVSQQSASGKLQGKSQAELTKGAGEYLKNLGELSRLTGESIDVLAQKQNEEQREARTAIATANMSDEAKKVFTDSMVYTAAENKDFANSFKNSISGIPDETAEFMMANNKAYADAVQKVQRGEAVSREEMAAAMAGNADLFDKLAKSTNGAAMANNGAILGLAKMQGSMSDVRNKVAAGGLKAAADEGKKSEAFTKSVMSFDNTVQNIIGQIKVAIIDSKIFQTVGNVVGWIAQKFLDFQKPLENFIKNFDIGGAIGGFLPKLGDGLSSTVTGIMPDLEKTFGKIISVATPFVSSIGNFFSSALGGINIDGISKSIQTNFTSVLTQFQYVIDNFFAPIFQTINQNLVKIGPKIGPIFNDLFEIASDLFGSVVSVVSGITNVLIPIVRPIGQFLIDAFTPLVDAFGVITSVVKGIVKLLTGDFSGFASAMTDAFGGIINVWANTIGAIVRLLGNILTPFKQQFDDIAEMIETFPLYIKKAVTSILPDWVSAKLGLATSDDIDKQLAARAKAMEEAKVKTNATPAVVAPTSTQLATVNAPANPAISTPKVAEEKKKNEEEKQANQTIAAITQKESQASEAKDAATTQAATLNTVSDGITKLNAVMVAILELQHQQFDAQKDLVNAAKGRYNALG